MYQLRTGSEYSMGERKPKTRITAKLHGFKPWAVRWLLTGSGYWVESLPPPQICGPGDSLSISVLSKMCLTEWSPTHPGSGCFLVLLVPEGASFCEPRSSPCKAGHGRRSSQHTKPPVVMISEHPGLFTSTKQELGLCTRRSLLVLPFSPPGDGWRRSSTKGVFSWGGCYHQKGRISFFSLL